jgi:hypothetical protein
VSRSWRSVQIPASARRRPPSLGLSRSARCAGG